MLRPDRVRLDPEDAGMPVAANAVSGEITQMEFLGGACVVTVATSAGTRLLADVRTTGAAWGDLAVGRRVVASWEPEDVHVLPADGTAVAPETELESDRVAAVEG